ncbi:MAG: rhomboid family intramembrane serine protease [Alcanivorax sp.]|jgi:GlpG protein|uniref:rhomboid family intramembrane serine protease n=1 Tax=Alcanivorax sp. TaxID=1872427 RepID=UPI00263811E7|nr:rhomboid family intramembrane serine protease [Alcanivorax sp.]MDF1723195.1 rhomboid family intramembrane serine protease [Alcanivorax sp.]
MELIRTPQPELAELFEHTLKRNGFAVARREEGSEQIIDLQDPAQYNHAKALLEELIADLRHQQGRQPVEPLTGRPQPLMSGGWFASLGWVTRIVLIVSVLVYLTPYLMGDGVYRALLFPAALDGLENQPWRLVTPMLLHFSLLHLLFNLLWWSDLGRLIERFQSSGQLVLVTLVTGITANVAQFFHTGPMFGGLSGVVYGLLGYLWIYGKVNPQSGYPLRREIVIFMLAWMVICFVGLSSVVANAAHLAGLVSGCLLGAGFGLWRRAQGAGAV